ncbi:MAG: GAF domain-containing protein, partial [Pirellulaceae bacterium]
AQVSPALEQTIVCDRPVQAGRGVSSPGTDLEDPERARDLLLLYQLSLELLRIDDPDEVVRLVLERLQHRTAASVVGFLWLSDEGELKPKQLFPPDASGKVRLSKSLTEVVCRKRHAVWIDNYSVSQNASTTGTLDHFAEAICVPVVHEATTLGALHLYLGQGKFTQSEFDISISVANMLVVALVRARQQALLATNHSRLMAKSADFDELIGE